MIDAVPLVGTPAHTEDSLGLRAGLYGNCRRRGVHFVQNSGWVTRLRDYFRSHKPHERN